MSPNELGDHPPDPRVLNPGKENLLLHSRGSLEEVDKCFV